MVVVKLDYPMKKKRFEEMLWCKLTLHTLKSVKFRGLLKNPN
jgi:hypothetical protein